MKWSCDTLTAHLNEMTNTFITLAATISSCKESNTCESFSLLYSLQCQLSGLCYWQIYVVFLFVSGGCCNKEKKKWRQRCQDGGARRMKEPQFSLFITFTICTREGVCGCAWEREQALRMDVNACDEPYLRFQAIICKCCLHFITFQ